jgi:hypothetical protein
MSQQPIGLHGLLQEYLYFFIYRWYSSLTGNMYRTPRPVMLIALPFYMWMIFTPHRDLTCVPPLLVTEIDFFVDDIRTSQ